MGEPIEERMMNEWASRLDAGPSTTHVRLGVAKIPASTGLDDAAARALFKFTLPEADLVRRLPDGGVEIVEFVVWRPQEAVGQLLFYRSLLTSTPGYESIPPSNLHLRIVSGLEDPRFRAFAESSGIAYEVFRPAWLIDALAKRRGGRS